jgi:lysophospholipase L1-like esterase
LSEDVSTDERIPADSRITRFDRAGLRGFSARDALVAIGVAAVLLVLFAGGSIRDAGEEMTPGIGRDVVLAFGGPAGWIADRTPLPEVGEDLTAWLSPDEELGGEGAFATAVAGDPGLSARLPAITPQYFDPVELGEKVEPRPLETLLVTGDSLSTPLDNELAQLLADTGVEVIADPHLAAAISNPGLVDWGRLSASQVAEHRPDAVVVFIGANEGYAIPGPGGEDVECCGADYAAAFAQRMRQMMDTYRQGGAAQVFWLEVPAARDRDRLALSRVVNGSIDVASQPWRDSVHPVDLVNVFTPGLEYRDSITIDGKETIVRESDGIHLNEAGSALAAEVVLERLDSYFDW